MSRATRFRSSPIWVAAVAIDLMVMSAVTVRPVLAQDRAVLVEIDRTMENYRLDAQITALTALRDGLDSCIGCGCLSLERCTISNPGDTARSYGPGAAYLPAGLRRSDGRLAGPPGRPHPRG